MHGEGRGVESTNTTLLLGVVQPKELDCFQCSLTCYLSENRHLLQKPRGSSSFRKSFVTRPVTTISEHLQDKFLKYNSFIQFKENKLYLNLPFCESKFIFRDNYL